LDLVLRPAEARTDLNKSSKRFYSPAIGALKYSSAKLFLASMPDVCTGLTTAVP